MAKPRTYKFTNQAYAITYGWTLEGCHPFVGHHYFSGSQRASDRGLDVAMFKTKIAAREALKIVKKKNPQAKIVPISATVQWESN